jgi:hypothetical protein
MFLTTSVTLTHTVDTQKTTAFLIPTDATYVGVFVPDLNNANNPTVGIEVYQHSGVAAQDVAVASLLASADTNWVPVLDNTDGADVVICATTKDPGYVDITPFLGALRRYWIRFTVSVAETATSTWWVVVK